MGGITFITPGIQIRDFHFDKGLLASVKAASVPMSQVYPFDREAVVAGRGSDLAKEVHLSKVKEDHIPVYRRMGGGCTVFLDPGNLIVSIAFPARGFGGIQTLFNLSSDWLIRGFKEMGLTGIYQDGISDLVMENKKIGGSCFYRTKGFAYYSAAVLVTPDLEKMADYLQHPPREPAYRNGRSHEDFVSGLNRFLPGITVAGLARSLSACLDPASMAA
jgi:lipoate-protein ligase A